MRIEQHASGNAAQCCGAFERFRKSLSPSAFIPPNAMLARRRAHRRAVEAQLTFSAADRKHQTANGERRTSHVERQTANCKRKGEGEKQTENSKQRKAQREFTLFLYLI